MSSSVAKQRPYRSHLIPACLACRKRKSRCKTDGSGKLCAMCEVHGTDCTYPNMRSSPSRLTPARRTRTSAPSTRTTTHIPAGQSSPIGQSGTFPSDLLEHAPETVAEGALTLEPGNVQCNPTMTERTPGYSIGGEGGTLDETEDDNVHVVGPVLANDNEVLEPYLSAIPEAGRYRRSLFTESSRMARPVLFTTMSRRPLGVTKNQTVSAAKCEIIEKLLEPHGLAVIQKYDRARLSGLLSLPS